jgi:hypothetical protein
LRVIHFSYCHLFFVSPRNVAPGKTRGGIFTTKHEYVAEEGKPEIVNRLKFGVYTQTVASNRWQFAERMTATGKHRLPPWRTVALADTFDEALLIMKNMITGMGASYEEDETGEMVMVDLLPGLTPSKGTGVAQKLFERSKGEQEINPHKEEAPKMQQNPAKPVNPENPEKQ